MTHSHLFMLLTIVSANPERDLSDWIGERLGRRYETVGEPDCFQWSIYEWDENGMGHGMWLVSDSGKWSVEYQVEGIGAFVVDYPSEQGILEWIELK